MNSVGTSQDPSLNKTKQNEISHGLHGSHRIFVSVIEVNSKISKLDHQVAQLFQDAFQMFYRIPISV